MYKVRPWVDVDLSLRVHLESDVFYMLGVWQRCQAGLPFWSDTRMAYRRCQRKVCGDFCEDHVEDCRFIGRFDLYVPNIVREESFKCDLCRHEHPLKRMRVYREGGIWHGQYCTDCYYGEVTNRGDDVRSARVLGKLARKPDQMAQDYIGNDRYRVRCTEHRDLRWEFGLLGKKTSRYGPSLKRKTS